MSNKGKRAHTGAVDEALDKETIEEVETIVDETNKEVEVEETPISTEEVTEEKPVEDTPEEDDEDLPPHVAAVTKNQEVKVIKKPTPKGKGIVVDCISLRIREGAHIKTRELAQIPKDGEMIIDFDNSTESFYSVIYETATLVVHGFSLKKFIQVVE